MMDGGPSRALSLTRGRRPHERHQTPEHPGLLQRFTNQGLAPSSSRSSDWSYPVDFWTGANGVDADAMEYWFGDYPQLLAR